MAKPKKKTNKLIIKPANVEQSLMIILLIAFLISAILLLVRNNSTTPKAELGEPSAILEQPAQ